MAVVEGKAYWASVTTPNTKFEPVYSVNLVIDEDAAKQFSSKGYTVKQMQEGPAIVLKRKVTNKKGQKNPLPKLLDVNQQPIDILVGNGSDVKVQYREWEATNSYGTFKGLDFQAMQVLNLVPYGGDATDDGAELGYIEEESEF
tara:strand:+ start:127 stop:558 length:432 start_codon:yes stop_codon:yes gene_type:complete